MLYALCSLPSFDPLPALPVDQMEVATIDENAGALTQNKYRITPVHCITEQNDSTSEAQIPESNWDQATTVLFAVKPLNQKTRAKCCLTDKTYDQPKGINFQSFLPPQSQRPYSAVAAT